MYSLKLSAKYLLPLELMMLLMLCACPDSNYTYYPGTFPETAVPLSGANSPYDDYNSMPPPGTVGLVFPLYFSSNRATQGGTFDIENFFVIVEWDQISGAVSVSAKESQFPSPWQNLNSVSNEFGPYYVDMEWPTRLYLFASDRIGNLDIYHSMDLEPVQPSVAFNSSGDDAYPALGPDNSVYFSSNRNGGYDILSAFIPAGVSVVSFLENADASIVPVDSVNSTWDDIAPYINGNLMLFASDRPGGHGGYDLWYSIHGEGGWSQPVNFGPEINSASDEFRPVVVVSETSSFTNDLMIFSSNRPGGEGGYDLYYVGIPRQTQ